MTARVWYPVNMEARIERAKTLVVPIPLRRGGKKKETVMPETNGQKIISKEIFDLEVFDTVRVGKYLQLPEKPKTLSEVVARYNNDESKLLDLLYEGMCTEAEKATENDTAGWHEMTADDQLDEEEYDVSKAASPNKKKLLNDMILNFAKTAFGFQSNRGKSDPKITESNKQAKELARAAIKASPAMIDSIVNAK